MSKQRPLPPFIQKRRRRYYAILEIPKLLRQHYPGQTPGKTLARLVRSLETDSLSVAERRAAAIIAVWRSEFSKLKNEGDDAAFFRRRLLKATTVGEREKALMEIAFAANDFRLPYLSDNLAHQQEVDEQTGLIVDDFVKRATNRPVIFMEHLDTYLDKQGIGDKTKAQARTAITRFAHTFPTVQDVTSDAVQRWIDAIGVGPLTIKRNLSSLRGYWKYLQRHDIKVAPRGVQPFDDLYLPKRQSGPGDRRKPFQSKDVIRLLIASENDSQLNDLIRLAMWTGCRLEELCSLKVSNVYSKSDIPYFEIEDAKTIAGWRQVPIHNALHRHAIRLTELSGDNYILSGLSTDQFGDRGNAIGHRFGRLKKGLGFDKRLVFHSIRKTVVTLLDNAGVPENVTADIVGHDKPRITYGLYSGGSNLKVKAEAIAKLSYRGH